MKIINKIAIIVLIIAITIGEVLNTISTGRLIWYIILLILNGLVVALGED